jgi:tRNA A-37 threonylcarbamoyl transferase component Bud32
MNDCPPAEHLLELAAGRLSDDSQAAVEQHIDTCVACRSALSSLAKRDAPSTSFGRYRLENVLGQGGMGIVYRAWDPQLARPVAIKVVRHAGADAQLRTRLVREAQSLARLSHPNVCHCYDVGTDGEEVWVAMELIEGSTLRAWALAIPRTQEQLLEVLLGAAEGIAAAHVSGLIHRDIKPENVLVTQSGRPVVTDFGLARIDIPVDPNASTVTGDPMLTATGAIVGTPAYLAPEQLTGDVLDARVDQFAWSVMAWELLTGTRPFPIIAAIRLDAIRAGVTAPASLPKPIAAALVRGMALNAKDRWPSMRELIDALKAKPGASRTPVLVGGAAVLAVAATVIGWQALRNPEQAAPVAAPIVADAAPTIVPPADAATEIATIATPDAALATVTPDAAPRPPKPRPLEATKVEAAAAPIETPQPTATQPPLRPLNNPKYSVARAYSSMMAWCRVPIDVKQPNPALGKHGIVDFGVVTRKEKVIATLGDREEYQLLYEVKGQRQTYRFDSDAIGAGVFGELDVPVGTEVALCINPSRPELSTLYKLPPPWSGGVNLMTAVFPTKGPHALDQLKKWSPLHVDDLKLEVSGMRGSLQVKPASHYLVQAKPIAKDGDRWDMKRWWLEVGKIKGADLVAPDKLVWFVIEAPTFEPDGDKTKMVAKAVLVLDEIIPH